MAKLGTEKHPAVVRVQTEEKAHELMALCQDHGIQVIVGIEPDEPEDTSDVDRVLNRLHATPFRPEPRLPPRISGNDYCPCGSGKKHKKCCGMTVAPQSSAG
jgi:SWIM/SEC-C metal-binding protein